MELDKDIYDKIVILTDNGNKLFEIGDFDNALREYLNALEILPEPKTDWEAGLWLFTAIGDVFFVKQNYIEAKNYFFEAINCPEGYANPFVLYRLGQIFYELKDFEKAKEYMLKAYMIDGFEIFEGENTKYIDFFKRNID